MCSDPASLLVYVYACRTSLSRNIVSGPYIGLPGRISAGLLMGKHPSRPSGRPLADGLGPDVRVFLCGFGRQADGLGPDVRIFLCGFGRLADGLGPDVSIFLCGFYADLDAQPTVRDLTRAYFDSDLDALPAV